MDPQLQYYGFSLIWIYLSSFIVFIFGIWAITFISNKLSISSKKAFYLYLWHTFFSIIHYIWVAQIASGDIEGTYINSLVPGYETRFLTTFFITKFIRIFSLYLRFSFFTTFLVINIIGTNVLLILEYFFNKYSKNFPRELKRVSSLFIWIPSLSFWTCLPKDALAILSILLIIFSLEKFNKRKYFLIPALIVGIIIRNYIFIVLIASILISITSSGSNFNNTKKILLLFISSIALFFVLPLVNDYLFKGDFQNINSLVDKINFNQRITSMGTYKIDPNANLLWRFFSYNFRPLFYDGYSLFGYLLSIDNFILLSIFSYLTLIIIKLKRYFYFLSDQFLIICSFSSFTIGFFLSLTTSNLGLASRHKWQYLTLLFILIMKVFSDFYNKRIKQ